LLLALCRFGQGIGLGGEWGGAVLLATENAPPGKRAWYGMFPQLGAPIGFFFSSAIFLVLSQWMTPAQFLSFGWRLPFLASGVLVLLGLYVRLTITETPVFAASLARKEPVRVPILAVIKNHFGALVAGILTCLATFVLFYLMIVFTLTWATTALHYSKSEFLKMQLVGVAFFALTIPAAAVLAEKGRKPVMLAITVGIAIFGLFLAPMFQAGHNGALAMLIVGLSLMGLTYGPLGTVLSELFPTPVRYTGSSLAFSIAGIVGASLAPYAALWLAKNHGLQYVGYYLSVSAVLTIIGLLGIRETKDHDMNAVVEAP
jgi:MFS family permease